MNIYEVFCVIIFTLGVYVINKRKVDSIAIFIFFIFFVYIFYNMGLTSPDHDTYIKYYVDTGLNLHIYNYEKGFELLNKFLFGIFKYNYEAVFIIYYTMMGALFAISIRYLVKIKREYLFIIPLIFVNMATPGCTLVRQYIAIGICLFAIRFLFNKKYIKFVLLVILASFSHVTALVFLLISLVVYFFMKKTKFKYKVIVSFVVLIILAIMLNNSYVQAKINGYIYDQTSFANIKFGLIMLLFLILNLVYAAIVVLKKVKLENEKEVYIFVMGLIYFVLYIGLMKYGFVSRIALYFQVFMYANICSLINVVKNKYLKLACYTWYLLLIIFIALKAYY
ncbi:MAG: EpsG family protein [Sarcina sp.]